MATNASAITTAEQLWAANLDQPCELIRGELILMSPASGRHGAKGSVLSTYLAHYILEKKLGVTFMAETGFFIERNPDTVLAPDFAFISSERQEKLGRCDNSDKFVPYAPDLVVEVKSPSDSYRYLEDKKQQWLEAGCQMVIVVDPLKRIVKQHYADGRCDTLDESATITGGDVVPGWEFSVKRIFAE